MEEISLTYAECKDYLRKIKDLEVSCYQLNMLRQRILNEQNNAKANIQKIQSSAKKPPEKTGIIIGMFFSLLFALWYGLLSSFLPGIALGVIKWFKNYRQSFWSVLSTNFFTVFAVFAGIIFVFLLVVSIIEDNDFPKKYAKYEEEEKGRLNKLAESEQRLQYLTTELTKCDAAFRQTSELLRNYYNLDKLYHKYWGIVPVCTIYEYLDSGRCFTLTGHEGAYNLYENELRLNLIIGKLDEVIYRLDEISNNQRILANEIRNSNAKINRISKSLSNIEDNTAMTEYYSSISAANTEFLKWLKFWDK